METEKRAESTRESFWLSPVRWIVAAHIVLLVSGIALFNSFPYLPLAQVVSAAVVVMQTMLLLVWLNLGGEPTAKRLFSIGGYVLLAATAHVPALWHIGVLSLLLGALPFATFGCALLGLPLALARSGGLRLKRFRSQDLPAGRRFQFTMFHLLWVTTFVAVMFALGQSARISPPNLVIVPSAARLAMVAVSVAVFLSVPLVSVWVVLTPGAKLPRFMASLLGGGLGGLLIVHCWGRGVVVLALPVVVLAVATVLLLATLGILRVLNYRAVWRIPDERMTSEAHDMASGDE